MLRVELSEAHESLQLEPRSCRSHGRHTLSSVGGVRAFLCC
jgi:hypothetical protein